MSSARFFNFCAANALDTTFWKHVDGTWQVIKDIDASDLQIELLDWQIDSRHVQPGDIFCSLPRAQFAALSDDLRAKKHQEMTSYIKMAIDRGARIIVSEESPHAFAIKDLSSDIFWVETRDICESLFAW